MSPFAVDLGERVLRTASGAFASYAFEAWLSTLIQLTTAERGLIFAAAATLWSVGWAFISRRIGRPGTASMTKTIDYVQAR